MEFAYSDKVAALQDKLRGFMDYHVYHNEARHVREIETGDRWQPTALMEELKAKAKLEGLWNLFLPHSPRGAALSNLEYAPLCEIMGRSPMASEVFNCSAPDTGNMETLDPNATDTQKTKCRDPLPPENTLPSSPLPHPPPPPPHPPTPPAPPPPTLHP